jgi:hypothetical protein
MKGGDKMTIDYMETKQERREKKRFKKKAQIRQHSKNLATIYKEAILKKSYIDNKKKKEGV